MTAGLLSERDDRVLVLTIDRPEVRNALDPAATLDAIAAALTEAALDRSIGAAVLTGSGHDSFSSGMDLRALERDRAEAARASRAFDAVMRAPDRIPIVAAVAGNAIGGGFEIAFAVRSRGRRRRRRVRATRGRSRVGPGWRRHAPPESRLPRGRARARLDRRAHRRATRVRARPRQPRGAARRRARDCARACSPHRRERSRRSRGRRAG